jgi:hypothetical protein
MTLDEILKLWSEDSTVDKTELGEESLKTISLHSKYISLYKKEKLVFIKLKKEYAKLYLEKFEFYTQGPSKETKDLGWEMPAIGAIIKTNLPIYIDADKELVDANLRIAMAQEKVDLLQDIVKEVQNRRWAIRAAIDWNKWISGG